MEGILEKYINLREGRLLPGGGIELGAFGIPCPSCNSTIMTSLSFKYLNIRKLFVIWKSSSIFVVNF